MYKANGILQYSIDWTGHKLICEIEQDIVDYYFWLIPKYLEIKRQFYPAHISIIRWETPINLGAWRKYDGQKVEFTYDSTIKYNETYVWLDVFSKSFQKIRNDLGLSPFRKNTNCFHITIGNIKNA